MIRIRRIALEISNQLARSRCFSLAALMGLLGPGVAPAQTIIHNATADFVMNLPNPNGVWTYGYTLDLASSLTPFAGYLDDTSALFFGWRTDLSLGAPGIFKNYGTSPGFGILPGQVSLHPGPNGEYAVLRFTAPAEGSYAVDAQFFAGDSGTTDATIVLNQQTASPEFYFPNTDTNPVANRTFDLVAGAKLDFAVGYLGSFFSDNTPFTVVIAFTPIPEPGTLSLLALGILLLVARHVSGRAKRQR